VERMQQDHSDPAGSLLVGDISARNEPGLRMKDYGKL